MWPRDGGGGAAGTTCAWLSPAGSEDRFRNIIYISLQAGKVGGMYKTEKNMHLVKIILFYVLC